MKKGLIILSVLVFSSLFIAVNVEAVSSIYPIAIKVDSFYNIILSIIMFSIIFLAFYKKFLSLAKTIFHPKPKRKTKKTHEMSDKECFHLKHGKKIKNVEELYKELKHMDDDTFQEYVNSKKNDFSSWLSDILKEKSLSNKIRQTKEKKRIVEILAEHVCKDTITLAKQSIKDKNEKESQVLYNKIKREYPFLSQESKKQIFGILKKLYPDINPKKNKKKTK